MKKIYWKAFIKDTAQDLKHLEKSMEKYDDDADIRASWDDGIEDYLKAILTRIVEQL